MKPENGRESGVRAFRNVIALGLVSFFTDVSSEMCFSILPTFILGLPGATRAILGFIEGVAEALSYSLRAVSGVVSDRFRRRKAIVFIGYALSNAVKPLFSVAQMPIDALIIRVSDRVGKGVRTSPRDALLSESVSEERMGAAFGLHRTLDQLGAILGPVFASAFMLLLGLTMRDVFWLSFIPGFVALLILLAFVRERLGKPRKLRILRGVKAVLRGRFSSLLLVVGLFSIGAFNFSFVLLRAKEVGVPDALIPMVYAVINVAHTATAIPAGLLSDKIGKEKTLIMGYGTFLASALLLPLPLANPLYAFFIAVVYGAYLGIVETVQRALVPGYARGDLRGTAYGLYYLVAGTSFLVANTTVGTLWEHVNLTTAVSYSAITSIIAITGMVAFLRLGK
jgi:MFS family permease